MDFISHKKERIEKSKDTVPHEFSSKIFGLIKFFPKKYEDSRGENFEGYCEASYFKVLSQTPDFDYSLDFLTDSFSKSKRDCLRGFHGDNKNSKLVQCLKGSILLVVIDTRKESPTFGNIEYFDMDDENRIQVFLPKGLVNAHLCLSDTCLCSYKLTGPYVEPEYQIHVKWNDPKYNVKWPINNPILSDRDNV